MRVASAERLRVGRTLDAGADGLMIPRLETVAEIAETLTWMRYPPDGIRGVALGTRGGGYAEIAHGALATTVNDRVLGVFQVESPAAVEASAETAAIDGVDVLFVGPADLSHSMGMPGRFDEPSFVAALDRVVANAQGARQGGGILLRDASAPRRPSPRASASSGSGRTRPSSSPAREPAWPRRAPAVAGDSSTST